MKQKTEDKIILGLIIFVIVLIVIAIGGFVLMLCWNYLMPVIFGLPQITFWQAIVMNILSILLFKQFYTYNK